MGGAWTRSFVRSIYRFLHVAAERANEPMATATDPWGWPGDWAHCWRDACPAGVDEGALAGESRSRVASQGGPLADTLWR